MSRALQNQRVVYLATGKLTIEQIVGVARYGWKVAEFSAISRNKHSREAYKRALLSREWIDNVVEDAIEANEANGRGKSYYGINTGFGAKAGRIPLDIDDIPWVSRNLIVSHSVGVGEIFSPEIVRAAMLIRANSLAKGYSGVRIEIINILVKMLNQGVCPVVPEHGSVGSSGDLSPLSHIGLVISKRPNNEGGYAPSANYDESGNAYLEIRKDEDLETELVVEINGYQKKYALLSGHEAMKRRGINPIELKSKEGLALNNGATFSAAIAVLALHDAENIVRHSEIATALSLESMLGFRDAFFPHIQHVRNLEGQISVGSRILKFVEGSTLLDGDTKINPKMVPPQDAYSLRATPQVVGAVWDTLNFVRQTITKEVNAATDNPLIFCFPINNEIDLQRDYKVVSGGNFHGAPVGYAMDFLKIVLTDLISLCERRIYRLIDPNLSYGLPSMIIDEEKPGQKSGMMIAQYMAAGIVSDCKTFSHPSSIDSIPTCAGQEDHVSMSTNAARHARKVVQNAEYVIAIELLCASLALEWRVQNLEKRKNKEFYKELQNVTPWIRDPEDKAEEDRDRVDEKILFLRDGHSALPGKGTHQAHSLIQKYLFNEIGLPELGKDPKSPDRYLRPYILWTTKLLQRGNIVENVYQACGLEDKLRFTNS